jgi:hypothetical protein
MLLTDDDHKIYENWEFISKRSFQEEVVEFLMYEEKLVSCFYLILKCSFFLVLLSFIKSSRPFISFTSNPP